jgi:diguanylate cyclase (GGDEF)-like protein
VNRFSNTAAELAPLVLDAATAAYALIDPSSGEVIWANRRFHEAHPNETVAASLLAQRDAPAGWRLRATPFALPGDSDPQLVLVELIPTGDRDAPAPFAQEIDAVTGVLARRALMATIEQRFAGRSKRPFALVFLDLVRFKHVNDCHGHLLGDKCLSEVGKRLQNSVRAADAVGRFGGDEFLIVLDGVRDPATYAPILRRLEEGIAAPIVIEEIRLQLGASLGVAYSEDGYERVEAMIDAADAAMYGQKRAANGSA